MYQRRVVLLFFLFGVVVSFPNFDRDTFVASHVYYVAPNGGSDTETAGTSINNPWATLNYSLTSMSISGGDELVVKNGKYTGLGYMTKKFTSKILIRAETLYGAKLVNDAKHRVLYFFEATNVILHGFEMYATINNSESISYLIQIDKSTNIVMENIIMHDSYNNDILKVNNYCNNVVIRGCMFYNQPKGGDEHIDANSITNTTIEDCIFFNNYQASGRANPNPSTSPFILVKSSLTDIYSENTTIRRNVFLNWIGSADQSFILLGEDGKERYEAVTTLIENNLFICNVNTRMSGVISFKGTRDVIIRSNTVTGYVNHVTFGYVLRAQREGSNPNNTDVHIYNNIFSDPSGRMLFISGGTTDHMNNVEVSTNLYFNNGVALTPQPNNALRFEMDADAIVADPLLQKDLTEATNTPHFVRETGLFNGNYKTIEEARTDLVKRYAVPVQEGSPALGAARAGTTLPAEDILGNTRSSPASIGAYQPESNPSRAWPGSWTAGWVMQLLLWAVMVLVCV